MTKDDIMKLALESGWDAHHAAFDTRIEAFYNLVVAAEREACAKLARKIGDATEPDDWALDKCQDIEAAIRARIDK